MSALYYTHSGTTSLPRFLLAVLAGSVLAGLSAALYAYLGVTIGIVLVTLVASIVLGVFIGWLASWVLRRGEVRNRSMAMAGTFVIALVALYANWVVWTQTVLQREGMLEPGSALVLAPGALSERMVAINARGAWELDDEIVRGGWLWAAWGAEALVILLLSVNYARHLFRDMPYCEECGSWCTPHRGFLETTNCKVERLKERMEARDFAFLEALGPRHPNDNFWFRFDLYTCPRCGATNTLTIDDFTEEWDDSRNRADRTSQRVIHNLLLLPEEARELLGIAERVKAREAAA